MIENSFIFIPGIAKKTEEYLWKKGILTWDDLECTYLMRGGTKRRSIAEYIQRGREALKEKDISFFAKHLPQNEHWRLYKDFNPKILYFDIETTGLSTYYDSLTLIGTFDGRSAKIFVKDTDLMDIIEHVEKYDMIVTFNGKLFDLPFVKNEIPNINFPLVHIDLRFLARSIGFGGPLKEVEKKMGIERGEEVKGIGGRDASVLWSRFIKGDDAALEKLILYNLHDVINLEELMRKCYSNKIEKYILPKMKQDNSQQKIFSNTKKNNIELYPPSYKSKVPCVSMRRYKDKLEFRANGDLLVKVDRSKIKILKIEIDDIIQKIVDNGHMPLSVGIDLSGSEKRNSGMCILDGKNAYLSIARTEEEIISTTLAAKPTIVSIDSPLNLPYGRCCTSDSCDCRKHGILRECERILKRRGVNVYPCLIKSMQNLTARGIKLSHIFEEQGLRVIESYPGAAQDILRFPRKRIDLEALKMDLVNMGIIPHSDKESITHDEIDALTSALVGYFYLADMYESIGNTKEGYLVIPDLKDRGE